jgi:thioredoxin reductase (NADPH)
MDRRGFLLTGSDVGAGAVDGIAEETPRRPFLLETSRLGVFAAGDVRHGSIKRVASAVGEGAMAVALIHQHLNPARS